MRGEDRTSGTLFSFVDVEARIAANHPLRAMRRLTNVALTELDARFSALYEGIGRPSIPPERLLRAVLLQLLYSIRSERQLVERLEFDMLFRWFVGLSIDEKVFDASTFSKNRDRFLTHEIAQEFLSSILGLPEVKGLLSAAHFSVDGTLLKAWASMKSFRPRNSRPKNSSGEGPGRRREAASKSLPRACRGVLQYAPVQAPSEHPSRRETSPRSLRHEGVGSPRQSTFTVNRTNFESGTLEALDAILASREMTGNHRSRVRR